MTGRSVLITGAGRGLGLRTALDLAAAGYAVYAGVERRADVTGVEAAATEAAVALTPIVFDVTSPDEVDAAVANVLAAHGSIDVLVSNAAVSTVGAFEDMHSSEMRRVFEVNFFGAVSVIRAVLPSMREAGSGTIVVISSAVTHVPQPGEMAYAAAKSALSAAAESLMHEVGRFGIRVRLFEPGYIDTGMGQDVDISRSFPSDSPYRDLVEHINTAIVEEPGDDPSTVTAAIREAIEDTSDRFRYHPGTGATEIVQGRRTLDESSFFAVVREHLDIDWWHSGEARPSTRREGAGRG